MCSLPRQYCSTEQWGANRQASITTADQTWKFREQGPVERVGAGIRIDDGCVVVSHDRDFIDSVGVSSEIR